MEQGNIKKESYNPISDRLGSLKKSNSDEELNHEIREVIRLLGLIKNNNPRSKRLLEEVQQGITRIKTKLGKPRL